MQPDDIPTEIAARAAIEIFMTYGQEDADRSRRIAKAVLAAAWPAIEAHVLNNAADRLFQENPDRSADFSEGVDWAIDLLNETAHKAHPQV